MKLTTEFNNAVNAAKQREAKIANLLDRILNHKNGLTGSASDLHFQKHIQNIAEPFSYLQGKLDILFTDEPSSISKAFIKKHAEDIQKAAEHDLLPALEELISDIESFRLDLKHQEYAQKIYLAFFSMIEDHQQLIIDYANLLKGHSDKNNGGNKPAP